MDLNFVNGNGVQKAACEKVARNLLNLPFHAIPLSLTIEFIPDPDPSQHNEFAITEYTYGSTSAKIKIASKAPNWGEPYRGILFLQEVFAHELGHAIFAALPESSRIAIANLFGAASDEISELHPPGSSWEDRYIEGIAETFKDAFQPQSMRRYSNRTNRHIQLIEYPQFRHLVREGIEGIEASPGFNHDVLELDFDTLGDEWLGSILFDPKFGGELNAHAFVYRAGYDLFERTIPTATTFEYSYTPPSLALIPEPNVIRTAFLAWRYFIKVNGEIADSFRGAWKNTNLIFAVGFGVRLYNEYYRPPCVIFDGSDLPPASFATWAASGDEFVVPEPFPYNYETLEDAIPLGATPCLIESSVTVDPGDDVSIHARALGIELAFGTEAEALAQLGMLEEPFAEALPTMHYFEPDSDGGEGIVLPTPGLESGPHDGGRVPTPYPVRG